MEKQNIRKFAYFFVFVAIMVLVAVIVVADIKYRKEQQLAKDPNSVLDSQDNTNVRINEAMIKNFLAENYEVLTDNGIDVDNLNTDDYIYVDDLNHIEYHQRWTNKYLDIWFDESYQVYDFDVRSYSYVQSDDSGVYVQEGGYEQ